MSGRGKGGMGLGASAPRPRTFEAEKILTTAMNFNGKGRSESIISACDHYSHEWLNVLEGDSFRWDNAAPHQEQARAGYLFGFVFTAAREDYIELREILEVMTIEDRRVMWDIDNPDQGNRVAIRLSDPIGHITSTALVQSSSNAPAANNGKMLMVNGTNVYTWDSDLQITEFEW